MAAHESLDAHRKVSIGSNRSFGVTFGIVFALIGAWPLVSRAEVRWWALAIAAAFLTVALLASHWLSPLNRAWFRLGLALHHVVNPAVMALLYFGAVVPMGLLLRMTGGDPLRLKRRPGETSYWIVREPPGPASGSLSKQF